MRRSSLLTLTGLAVIALTVLLTAASARADDFGKRITVNVAPLYIFTTAGDANAPAPPGYTCLGCPTAGALTNDLRIDYGAALMVTPKINVFYAHTNFDLQLGRILLAPSTALVTGDITNWTDTFGATYAVGHGLGAHALYFNHQRPLVAGLCLNQQQCPNAAGFNVFNGNSINEHGYMFGGTYDFGPNTRVGPLFTAAFDAKYIPRPSTPNCPAVAPPNCNAAVTLGGLGSYVGTQWLFPYSLTMKLPVSPTPTFYPFINYSRIDVLYRNSAVPEVYNGYVFGIVKVINKNATLSYTNINLMGCKCSAVVPGPDNLRWAGGILRLDLHTGL
jgi:hypothetical protein